MMLKYVPYALTMSILIFTSLVFDIAAFSEKVVKGCKMSVILMIRITDILRCNVIDKITEDNMKCFDNSSSM